MISIIEDGRPGWENILSRAFTKTGHAYRIGITGPPGAGKSSLTNLLVKLFTSKNLKTAVIAVDPTSPFTGGALLGDRVRMRDITSLGDTYIRSMASRGSLGGLSRKTVDAADIIDAAGFDIIILETVGVGQSELDIARLADCTIVTLVPESGDSIQAMKAGLMEIADLFVLNKCDRPGSDSAYSSLKTILSIAGKEIPVIKTIASTNGGITELAEEILKLKESQFAGGVILKKRKENYNIRIRQIISEKLSERLWTSGREQYLRNSLENLIVDKLSPFEIADRIIKQFENELK